MALEILVLAAGVGKRMRSSLPKVLQPLAGRPLLAHVLATARELSPRKVIVVHGHGAEAVREAFNGEKVEWVLQDEQLGTAHAVMQAMPRVSADADVLILYGDVPLTRAATLKRLLEAAGDGLAVLTAEPADPAAYGRIVRDGSGGVAKIVEQRDASPGRARDPRDQRRLLCAQRAPPVGLAEEDRQPQRAEGVLPHRPGVAGRRREGAGDGGEDRRLPGKRPASIRRASSPSWSASSSASRPERLLDAGVRLADPARIDVRGALECGREVSIDVNCVFEGRVTLGDGVRIGPNCVLRNISIAAGTEVLAFCHLEDSAVGARCRLGPYARLRPGSTLDEDVHVGNFVEVKASRLGAGSKANHLTYLGDSEIGARVNVGAGTITCNYDGAAKHRTVIEDDCFIGSDATLVAPVRIAQGSYIGAGSTINKDTPAGQLTVARAKQVSIPGWKPPKKKA